MDQDGTSVTNHKCRVQWGTMLAPFGKKSRARTTSAKSLGSKTAWPCFGRRLLAKDAKAMPRCGLGLNQLRIFFAKISWSFGVI